MERLLNLVELAGGTVGLALYLELPQETLEQALRAPAGAWTDRVAAMVAENTEKLLGMPNPGGFFWRLTRRRVAKDWLILSRWSEATA